jgi:hypothetical protein
MYAFYIMIKIEFNSFTDMKHCEWVIEYGVYTKNFEY